jgi:hypothetical protein
MASCVVKAYGIQAWPCTERGDAKPALLPKAAGAPQQITCMKMPRQFPALYRGIHIIRLSGNLDLRLQPDMDAHCGLFTVMR